MLLSIASNFQEEQHYQGRWTKRFSQRQRKARHKPVMYERFLAGICPPEEVISKLQVWKPGGTVNNA